MQKGLGKDGRNYSDLQQHWQQKEKQKNKNKRIKIWKKKQKKLAAIWIRENETYKYLDILVADTIKQVEIKDTIQKEYLRRTRKLLETELSGRKLIKGINTWAVSLVRYSGPFLKWTRDELKQMD